jgi:hypothetical protein
LSILAKYWYSQDYKKHDICNLMNDFMVKNYKGYNPVSWDLVIEKIVTKAKKYPLIQVNFICITKHELETIQELQSKRMQRVAFTLLCLAKFYDAVNEKNNDWANSKINDIFRMARVQISKNNKTLMLNDLRALGLIEYSVKVDNDNVNVQFVDNESEVILQIDDFRELGYEYMRYCGDGKFINCDDCGRLIKLYSKDNQTVRCAECQKKRDNETAKIRMRKFRNK